MAPLMNVREGTLTTVRNEKVRGSIPLSSTAELRWIHPQVVDPTGFFFFRDSKARHGGTPPTERGDCPRCADVALLRDEVLALCVLVADALVWSGLLTESPQWDYRDANGGAPGAADHSKERPVEFDKSTTALVLTDPQSSTARDR